MKFRISLFLLLNLHFSQAIAAEKKQRIELTDDATARAISSIAVGEPKHGLRYVILSEDKNYYLRFNSEAKGPHDRLEVVPRDGQDLLNIMKDPATHFRFILRYASFMGNPNTWNIVAQNQQYLSARMEKEKPEDKHWPVSLATELLEWEGFKQERGKDDPLPGMALRSCHQHYLCLARDRLFLEQHATIGDWERLSLYEVPFNFRVISDSRELVKPILADSLQSFSLDVVGEVADFLYEKPDPKSLGYWVTLTINGWKGFEHVSKGLVIKDQIKIAAPKFQREVAALMNKWFYESGGIKFKDLSFGPDFAIVLLPQGSLPAIFATPEWHAWKAEMAELLPHFQEQMTTAEKNVIERRDREEFVARTIGTKAYPTKEAAVEAGVVFDQSQFANEELVVVFSKDHGCYIYAELLKRRGVPAYYVEFQTPSGRQQISLNRNEIGKIPPG